MADFQGLYDAFIAQLVVDARPLYAATVSGLRERFPEVWVLDGSRLDQVAHRLKLTWDVRSPLLPGCVLVLYDLFRGLLRRARAGGIAPDYAARLLGLFRVPTTEANAFRIAAEVPTVSAPRQPGGPGAFVEPLTDRERDIVRLIVAGASNREIARRLVVTTNTVKVHVYHLFGKLDVKSRTQAAIRAKELRLD